MTEKECLKKYFGYDSFRKGQEEIVKNILDKKDTLAIMPTGAGKSLCYQIPAIMFSGITFVISPLISLMKDQVDALNENGIKAAYINSSLKLTEYRSILEDIHYGVYKIIYIAPERLETNDFLALLAELDVSMVAIDEAHCVSQWGHDFRPSYKKIANFISSFKKRPVVTAFTATATNIVKEDVITSLELQDPYTITTGFDRKNLYFKVEMPSSKDSYITDYVKLFKDVSGIIYCSTRKNVNLVCEMLDKNGYLVTKYHAGLTDKERLKNQEDFIYDRKKIMVATNAFGMGIDKSNIRYVIHYNMPGSLENYYQEAGRAGRDGENSECVMLFSNGDIATNLFLIKQGKNEYADTIKEREKLNKIIEYCRIETCFRKYILEYFGEKVEYEKCDNCSNCNEAKDEIEVTIESQKVLSCIKKMNGRFGAGMVADVLRGSKNARIIKYNLDKLSTYGIMKDYEKTKISQLINLLNIKGYIEITSEEYGTIDTTTLANEVLFKNKKVYIRTDIKPKSRITSNDINFDQELFNELRSVRNEISKKINLPAYLIMQDATLKDMCIKFPRTKEEFLNIYGIGMSKYEKYGELFISKIEEYILENNINVEKNIEDNVNKSTSNKSDVNKVPTCDISYLLYKEGKTIEQIAEIRKLSRQTIEGHLLDCYEEMLNNENSKYDINISDIVNTVRLDEIIEAIKNFGYLKLRILKDNLPADISYAVIRYGVIMYKKMLKDNEI